LASLREPEPGTRWLNYRKYGIGPEDGPDLIRIATSRDQFTCVDNPAPAVAAVHAWRALGQLGAIEAVEPLLGLLEHIEDEDGDFLADEMRDVLPMLGPKVLPQLTTYLSDPTQELPARWVVADAIGAIGEEHEEHRQECVDVLCRQLERSAEQERDPQVNGMLIDALVGAEAVEAAPVIERIFRQYPVDVEIGGTWEEAQFDLGLLEEDEEDEDCDESEEEEEDYPSHSPGSEWRNPALPTWEETLQSGGKTPKQRAEERAKARRKQKKKKK
jgi:HEAT repeat protein